MAKDNPANRPVPAQWRLFPATKTNAYYESLGQYIELSEVDSVQLQRAMNERNPRQALPVLPVLFHEARHWIDHIGTLWGARRLVLAFNAIHAREENDPNDFWRIVNYRRLVNRDGFARYYTTIEGPDPPAGVERKWAYQVTCGLRFDETGRLSGQSPILFTQYAWPNGTTACRVPFSVASLLETNAMYFETELETALAHELDPVEREIEFRMIRERRLPELYCPELGKYSTAVHLVANRMKLPVASSAYPLASALASLCLNLPEHMFDRLAIPDEFEKWGERNLAAIRCRDRGYAYLLLATHARQENINAPLEWVRATADRAGLPSLEQIRATDAEERESIRRDAVAGPHRDRFNTLFEIGTQMFETFGVIPMLRDVMDSLAQIGLPPVFCNDLTWHFLGARTALHDERAIKRWVDKCYQYQTQFDEFMDACGL